MRLTRSASTRRRVLPIQPPAVQPNYKLARFTINKTGLIVGVNRFGSMWFELHIAGVNVFEHFFVNMNPYITKPRRRLPLVAGKRRVTA